MLADYGDRLGGSDVVARLPIVIPRGTAEILLDDMFPPRESVATAHAREIIAEAHISSLPEPLPEFSRPLSSLVRVCGDEYDGR